MKMDLRNGKVCSWALIFSVAAHSVTLAVFTGVKISKQAEGEVSSRPVLSMQMIEQVVAQPTPKPKPRVEPIAEPLVQSETEEPPLVSDSKLSQPPEAKIEMDSEQPQAGESVIDSGSDEVEFFGQKSIVSRVCYVVDCSGSMYGQMYLVKDQLKRSILNLSSRQAFSVVFFKEGQTALSSSGNTLAPATAGFKSAAFDLIESIRPSGTTDAGHALDRALQLKDASGKGVEVVYFLTDGFDLDSRESQLFVGRISRLLDSYDSGIVLHTIGFDAQPRDRQMLKQLAHQAGGVFIDIR
jgi:Mg-chelatase subunit ChlD